MKENYVMGGGIPLFLQSMVIYKQESQLVCAAFVLILHVFALVFTHTPFLQHPSSSKSIKKIIILIILQVYKHYNTHPNTTTPTHHNEDTTIVSL
jgi:hypothetical protein